MHYVVVAREQCCRVGVLVHLHKVGPMIVVIWHVLAKIQALNLMRPDNHTYANYQRDPISLSKNYLYR